MAVYGNPTIKRIYGDWTTPNMGTWKPLLLEHAITPDSSSTATPPAKTPPTRP